MTILECLAIVIVVFGVYAIRTQIVELFILACAMASLVAFAMGTAAVLLFATAYDFVSSVFRRRK